LIDGFTPLSPADVDGVSVCLSDAVEADVEIGAEIVWVELALCEARFISAPTAPALTATPMARMNICSFIKGILLFPCEKSLNLCWA
jgi:hypothetical protein